MQVECVDNRVLLTDLTGWVKPYVPDIPDNGIEHALRQAIIEFAMKTLLLRRHTCIDLQECVIDYYIDDTEEECVYMIEEVCTDDCRIYHYVSQTQCDYWCGSRFQVRSPNCIIMQPAPICDQKGALKVSYFVVPSQDSCFIPDEMYKFYSEGISALAIHHLLLTNGNEQLATKSGIWLEKAQRAIGKAKSDGVFNQFHSGSKNMRTPRWF